MVARAGRLPYRYLKIRRYESLNPKLFCHNIGDETL